jgi:antitoxin component YwqK of YwqJK toxin-antitoxin module
MKPSFFITTKVFHLCFFLFCLLICFNFCTKKAPKPVFDLSTPGAEVVASYNDSIPQVVFYYKVDENGNQTQEKIGESYYYENKQEYVGGGLKDGKRDGKWYAFFRNGSVQTEAFYIDGQEHGAYNVYRENGKPLYKAHYDHGICDGTWYFYDEEGTITEKKIADKNTIVCGYCQKCLKLKQKN